MGEYLTPGVYTENVSSGYRPLESVSTTTGAFIGITKRGIVGKPTLVTSWSDYIRKYAGGMETPFMTNSDLAYAVHGFFTNGGKRCFIVRVDNGSSVSASAIIGEDDEEFLVQALDEGDWGNEVEITITKNTDFNGTFDVAVKYKSIKEIYTALTNDIDDSKYFAAYINKRSSLVKITDGKLVETTATKLRGGLCGNDALLDKDYLGALEKFDPIIDDVNLLAIPGQTSTPMLKGILDYCAKTSEVFPILEMPPFLSVMDEKEIRKDLTGIVGAIYDGWYTVVDPISTTGEPRIIPPSGHIMGTFARTIMKRGTHKAPAGVECDIRGIIDLTARRSTGETDMMNPVSINAVIAKPNYGIVIWGARTLSVDTNFKYVSDQLFNIMIKKSVRNGTQWLVFEPNDEQLWRQAKITVRAYLHTLWLNGQLMGKTADEAFWVQVDEENNPEETRNQGFLYIDFAYAPIKPAEFIVERITHSMITTM